MSKAVVAEAPGMIPEYFAQIDIAAVFPSTTNPRTHFSEVYIRELAGTIKDKGVIQPLIVRPTTGLRKIGISPERAAKNLDIFEIVAGECRYRAAKLAAQPSVPAIVREYTDEQALEVQLIENLHRTDLTPLEQAVGYRRLITANPTKHSAETIATRIGMSPAWVWDRLKLNDLIPEAKMILDHGWMTVGHAILIARLKPEDQARALAIEERHNGSYPRAGLWRTDQGFDFDEDDPANKGRRRPTKYERMKPCSIRELEAWIRDHVRFDVAHAAQAQPLTFEATAARVDEAAAKPGRGKKVIAISFDHHVQADARSDAGERTFGPRAFKFADGQSHTDTYPRRTYVAATCDHVVLGVVAAGENYGQTFDVCIARDTCTVHWRTEIAERERGKRATGKQGSAASQKQKRDAEERRRKEAERRDADERRAWQQAQTRILAAAAAAIGKAKVADLAVIVLAQIQAPTKEAATLLKAGSSAEDVLRICVLAKAIGLSRNAWVGPRELPTFLKPFKVDVAALLKAGDAAPATPGKRTTATRKTR